MSNANATQEITIQGAVFSIPAPYAEGTPLKANEAAAINQLFAENIRNNQATLVKEAKAKKLGKELKDCKPEELVSVELDDSARAELQSAIDAYAANYEFGVRVGGKSKDPLERRIEEIATKYFEQALRTKGITPSKLKKDNNASYTSALAQFIAAKRAPFEKEARKQLKSEADIANGVMDGIDFSALGGKSADAGTVEEQSAEVPEEESAS